MEDYEIKISVEKEMELRRNAVEDPESDPSLYAPFGKLNYGPEYKPKKCDRTD